MTRRIMQVDMATRDLHTYTHIHTHTHMLIHTHTHTHTHTGVLFLSCLRTPAHTFMAHSCTHLYGALNLYGPLRVTFCLHPSCCLRSRIFEVVVPLHDASLTCITSFTCATCVSCSSNHASSHSASRCAFALSPSVSRMCACMCVRMRTNGRAGRRAGVRRACWRAACVRACGRAGVTLHPPCIPTGVTLHPPCIPAPPLSCIPPYGTPSLLPTPHCILRHGAYRLHTHHPSPATQASTPRSVSRVTHVNESCHKHGWVMSNT